MSRELNINGGVAVITGAASGIGMGLARHAAGLGMRLVLADINASQLEQVASSLNTDVLSLVVDVRDPAAVEDLAAAAFERFGQVDLLFNNAGIISTGLSWEIPLARWQQEFDVNVRGVLHGIHAFVPRLLEANRPAHIINTASVGGFLPSAMMSPYTATKAAIVAMTESLQAELRLIEAPIGVSLLGPGPVQSAIFNDPFTTGVEGGDSRVEEFTLMLRAMLAEYGLSPEHFANHVFAAIREGAFWILPQPEALDAALRRRMENILARENPPMNWS